LNRRIGGAVVRKMDRQERFRAAPPWAADASANR